MDRLGGFPSLLSFGESSYSFYLFLAIGCCVVGVVSGGVIGVGSVRCCLEWGGSVDMHVVMHSPHFPPILLILSYFYITLLYGIT